MKIGKDKRAIITSNWQDVVKKMKMKEDGIYMFWFHRTENALGKSLKLIVDQVK
jgi:UDP-N-acetylglucosamine 2-epimerase